MSQGENDGKSYYDYAHLYTKEVRACAEWVIFKLGKITEYILGLKLTWNFHHLRTQYLILDGINSQD